MKEFGWVLDCKLYFFVAISSILSLTSVDSNAQQIEWEQSHGWDWSNGGFEEFVDELIVGGDGGFVSIGQVYFPGIYNDLWIIKTNSSGEEEWQQTFGGGGKDMGHSIKNTSDGGYIVTGETNTINGNDDPNNPDSHYYIVKFSEAGVLEWDRIYGGEATDVAYDGFQTADGGYIVTGVSNSVGGDITNNHGGTDAWVIKLSEDGMLEWEKSLGGSNTDRLFKIILASDGGYILAGYSDSNDGDLTENSGDQDLWIVKLNTEGEIVWQNSLGGSSVDAAWSVQAISNGGYILTGTTNSIDGDVTMNQGGNDVWVLELSSTGDLVWQKTYGGEAEDRGREIQLTSDGGYVLVASSSSLGGDIQNPINTGSGYIDYWALKISSTGSIEWERLMGGSGQDVAASIKETEDGGFIIGGSSNSSNGDISSPKGEFDFWLVKLQPVILGVEKVSTNGLLGLYPNPATDYLNIETDADMIGANYSIFNSVGQLVISGKVNSENTSIEIKDFAKGFYVLQLQNTEGSLTAPFVRE